MSLYQKLQKAITEEDVKDLYIEELDLKNKLISKGKVDFRTKNIWFEAKATDTSVYKMFAQLLHYVKTAQEKGEPLPSVLSVVSREYGAICETQYTLNILAGKIQLPNQTESKELHLDWNTQPSSPSASLVKAVEDYLHPYMVIYKIQDDSQKFKQAITNANHYAKIRRTPIISTNLKEVFNEWVQKIGQHIINDKDRKRVDKTRYPLLFYADLMTDGNTPVYKKLPAKQGIMGGEVAFVLYGESFSLESDKDYNPFWNIYNRPPEAQARVPLLERHDQLLLDDYRKWTGAYYTPNEVVEQAYKVLDNTLGNNWQEDYTLWDMCCGVGNLENRHQNMNQVFMSTLEKEHKDIMEVSGRFYGAEIFQYDYLNDDITPEGEIDYSLSGKIPAELREILEQGEEKVLILINPPYAEATAGIAIGEKNKADVTSHKIDTLMQNWGKASNELFTQFVARITREFPKGNCTLAMFSTLKYVNAPNFIEFRTQFKAKFLGGFMVHSKAFDNLKGDFPIGFLTWQLNHQTPITKITLPKMDKNFNIQGEHSFKPFSKEEFLNNWLNRPRANKEKVLPLTGAIKPVNKKARAEFWNDNAIGYIVLNSNDIQHTTQMTFLLSSIYSGGNGMYITAENLSKASIMFTVRRIVKPTWYNDRDQFLIPHTQPSVEFENDCLLWMLFNGSNLTASANNLEYNGKTDWKLTNYFVPYTAQQMEITTKLPQSFMVDYLKQRGLPENLSPQALEVYKQGLELFKTYHKRADNLQNDIKEKYKLGNSDVGWYQIRNALKLSGNASNLTDFEKAYQDLTDKILPQVYTYGFLIGQPNS